MVSLLASSVGRRITCAIKTNIFRRVLSTTTAMANSKFEYVREFEKDDRILPNTWIVVRIDGKAFHKFTDKHAFEKPNDDNGLLINTSYLSNSLLTLLYLSSLQG